jgi:hypothetical protein
MSELDLEGFFREVRERLLRIEEKLQPQKTCVKYPVAAEMLGIGLTKLKSMVRNGQLHPSLVGDRPMISLAEIQRISAPVEERPRIERRQREAKWVPIEKRKPKKR